MAIPEFGKQSDNFNPGLATMGTSESFLKFAGKIIIVDFFKRVFESQLNKPQLTRCFSAYI
jgi:hypothetical protein